MVDKCLVHNDTLTAHPAREEGNGTSNLPSIAIVALRFCGCSVINGNQLI